MAFRGTSSRGTGFWVVVGLGVVLLVALVFLTPLGDYLGASVTSGPDRGSAYTPLVRSQQSLNHKYDIGTDACEQDVTQAKEFTIGYLFKDRPAGLSVQPLYGCHVANTPKCAKKITLNRAECGAAGLSYFGLGFVAQETNFEAAVPLVKCTNAEADDTLLTNDTRECQLAGYEGTTQLGYVASAGYLPLRNLDGLCAAIAPNCAPTTQSGICNAYRGYCQ